MSVSDNSRYKKVKMDISQGDEYLDDDMIEYKAAKAVKNTPEANNKVSRSSANMQNIGEYKKPISVPKSDGRGNYGSKITEPNLNFNLIALIVVVIICALVSGFAAYTYVARTIQRRPAINSSTSSVVSSISNSSSISGSGNSGSSAISANSSASTSSSKMSSASNSSNVTSNKTSSR